MHYAVCFTLPKLLIQKTLMTVSPRQVPKHHQQTMKELGARSETLQ